MLEKDPALSPIPAPAPATPPPMLTATASPAAWWHLPTGFAILVVCLEAGEAVKRAFALILPGNMLGLFLLLALLGSGMVPLRWVEGAARWLLWLLPLLFMPIFVYALHNRDFWLNDHGAFAGVVALATLTLWLATGHLAQWFMRRHANPVPHE